MTLLMVPAITTSCADRCDAAEACELSLASCAYDDTQPPQALRCQFRFRGLGILFNQGAKFADTSRFVAAGQQSISLLQSSRKRFIAVRIALDTLVVGLNRVFVIPVVVIALANVILGVGGARSGCIVLEKLLEALDGKSILTAVEAAHRGIEQRVRVRYIGGSSSRSLV